MQQPQFMALLLWVSNFAKKPSSKYQAATVKDDRNIKSSMQMEGNEMDNCGYMI